MTAAPRRKSTVPLPMIVSMAAYRFIIFNALHQSMFFKVDQASLRRRGEINGSHVTCADITHDISFPLCRKWDKVLSLRAFCELSSLDNLL